MNSSTGRWVDGDDFIDRELELQILETRIRHHNHVLLTGRYLERGDSGHRFMSRLLKDWWLARFRDHHTPLAIRRPRGTPAM